VRAFPAVRAARGGLTGRRLQATVIGVVVLATTAASVLALGMLVDSNAPFDHAFAAQRGAQVAATVDTSVASPAQLAATTRLPSVTAASGPFPVTTVSAGISIPGLPGIQDFTVPLTGRASPGGPVDDLTLQAGHWPQAPGQVVWSGQGALSAVMTPGAQLTVTSVKGSPKLTVVGIATSVTNTALAWVLPAEITALRGSGVAQMLYRFSSAGSAGAVAADIAAVRAALPRGALIGTPESYLTVQQLRATSIAPWVPFIVAFGVIALVMSVLIVVNVVSGAVVAGIRRIGVLKSIGFTPFQVVAAYVLQVAVPAVVGCVAGAVVGNLLAAPLLSRNAQVYGVGKLSVPLWVDVVVPLAMLALTGVAALLPALRAGRMSATAAIATGRAPRPSHGYAAQRLLARVRVAPRVVTLGLAAPFARPTRTFVTLAAILFGAVAVTFGAGLATSLNRAEADLSLARSEPVQVQIAAAGPAGAPLAAKGPGAPEPGGAVRRRAGPLVAPDSGGATAAQQRTVVSALRSQPGTLHYVPETDHQISVIGLSDPLSVISFGGDASWTGYGIVTGRWYTGTGEADVNTYFLTATGTAVGDTYPLSSGGRQTTVRIVGEIFDPGSRADMFMSSATLAAVAPGLAPQQYDVGVQPGVNVQRYANALSVTLGPSYVVSVSRDNSPVFQSVLVLVGLLTVLLIVVAGLGVLNTVVLQIRERVHDLGVFKAIGMTPRQTIAMVVCSVTGIGIVAGLIAIPAGIALHDYVVPIMGHGAQTNLPAAVASVYRPWELVLLALSGLVIAVAGALAPAGWAAQTRTALALHAE
jgi:putative ABC transport system permease protein